MKLGVCTDQQGSAISNFYGTSHTVPFSHFLSSKCLYSPSLALSPIRTRQNELIPQTLTTEVLAVPVFFGPCEAVRFVASRN